MNGRLLGPGYTYLYLTDSRCVSCHPTHNCLRQQPRTTSLRSSFPPLSLSARTQVQSVLPSFFLPSFPFFSFSFLNWSQVGAAAFQPQNHPTFLRQRHPVFPLTFPSGPYDLAVTTTRLRHLCCLVQDAATTAPAAQTPIIVTVPPPLPQSRNRRGPIRAILASTKTKATLCGCNWAKVSRTSC